MIRANFEDKLQVNSLHLIVLAVPLVVAPGLLYSAVDLPKRILLELLVIAAWLGACSRVSVETVGYFRRLGGAFPLAAIAAWAFIVSIGAANPRAAIEMAGLQLAYSGLAAAAMFLVSWAELRKVLYALMASTGIVAVYGILQYAGVDFLPWESSWGSRCFGTIGNPVFFAGFLAPALVLITAGWLKEEDDERKDLYSLLIMAIFLALIFSQSRGAWLGCVAGWFVLGMGFLRYIPDGRAVLARNRWRIAALLGFGLAAIATVSSKAILGEDALPLKDRVKDAVNMQSWTVRHRFVLWRAAGIILRDAPLAGIGLGHYRSAFPMAQASFRGEYTSKGFEFAPKETQAHNDYAQAAAEQGLIGLGLWLWLLWVIFCLGIRAMRSGAEKGAWAAGMLGGCCSLCVDACFNFPFSVIPAAMVFWLFVGGLARLGNGIPMFDKPRMRRHKVALVAAACLAFVLGAFIAVPALRADRFYARGIYYLGANMWEMSAAAFRKSLSARPYDSVARYQLGYVLFKSSGYSWTGEIWDKALVEFRRAHELGLNDEMVFDQMALIFEKKMDYDRSIEMSEKSIHIYPENLNVAANLAYWLSIRERDLVRADMLSHRVVEAAPGHPLFWWTRGLVLEKLGRYRESLDALGKVPALLGNIKNGAAYEAELGMDIERVRRLNSRKI